jgi:hypothetical protein
MNFLFKDGITSAYLKHYTDYIATKISKEELNKFKANNITLLLAVSPGNVISNFAFSPNNAPTFGHIVIVEKNILEFCNYSFEEKSALILHEFGHIFNNSVAISDTEFYADYYAKSLGFGTQLASALQKFLAQDFSFINDDSRNEIRLRINQLNNVNQIALTGALKQLTILPENYQLTEEEFSENDDGDNA